MARGRILVVEDDESIRCLAVDYLSDEGFEVVEAENGDIALKHLKDKDHFDVLFTDVRMPGRVDGIDLVACARDIDPQLKVIVASGYANQLSDRLRKLKPPVRFFKKPYVSTEVVAAIRELLS